MPRLETGRFQLGENDFVVVCQSSFGDKSRKPILALLTYSGNGETPKFTCPNWNPKDDGFVSQSLCSYVPCGQTSRNCPVLEIL